MSSPPRRPPPPTAAEIAAERNARHARWIAALSDLDWQRIRDFARQVTPTHTPARLDDLDAKGLAVGVCAPGSERYMSGERIGTIRTQLGEIPVLVWRL